MAKYSSADFQVWFDNTGGTPVDMSAYITDAGDMEKEIATEEITPFSAANEAHASSGVSSVKEIVLKGAYDDTATTGPHVIFNALGDTRTLKYVWGGAKTTSVETIIANYKRLPKVKNLVGFEVKLLATGAVTEV